MKFIPTFPTFIFGKILKNLPIPEIQEYKDFILKDSYKKDDLNNSSFTINQQILNNNLFKNLKYEILSCSRIYLNKLNHNYTDIQISSSWSNLVNKNEGISAHVHTNSYVSGVFYFDTDSPINFLDPLDSEWYFKPSINSKPYSINPIPNLLILFPSFLPHSVSKSQTTNPRISIAFNIIPKGEFGFDTQKLYL